MNRFYLYLIVSIFFSCDGKLPQIEAIYRLAEENQLELQSVLEHYSGEEQKLAAAKFLLNNMFHSFVQNNLSEAYRNVVLDSDIPIDYNAVWKGLADSIKLNNQFKLHDARSISADYLIKNIDESFRVWKQSPWYDEIDFEIFCNYILPYRVLDEPISDWRKPLNQKYKHLIEGIENPQKAFAVIYHHILKEFKDRSHKYPYTPDVLMLDKMQEGVCSFRCIYLISVLRSLGIPAAYDMVYFWANYSQGGHSWVAYVGNGGKTETMLETDSIPKEKNAIDSSIFSLDADIKYNPEQFQYKVDSLKKVSKVYRRIYRVCTINDETYSNQSFQFFNHPYILDVSLEYGIVNEIKYEHKDKQQLFLCTFAAIKNWQPAVKGKRRGTKTIFENIGSDIVYLPIQYSEGQIIPVENPFILYADGGKKALAPDMEHKERVVLRRKYLLFAHWINRWSKIIGSGIDGSDTSDFNTFERLYTFTGIPDGIIQVSIEASKPYRYIRFQAPPDARPNIAEMRFRGVDHLKDAVWLTGNIICKDIDSEKAMLAFDNTYSTYTQTSIDNYWFGLDLGKNNNSILNGVEFCMRHDMNMIEIGDNYELFYYDYGWRSLGKQIATCDSLVYEDVPSQALLWLKNHTKGREERIFTYEGGKQIWW